MSMYKCPVCGELFSTSYKKCPFCEEDDLLMDRRKTNSRRSRRNEPRAVGPLLIVIFLMLVALVVFLVWEITFYLHPERFWEGSNENLQCANCPDQLCGQRNCTVGLSSIKNIKKI